MIDMHIIHNPKTNKNWFKKALDSIPTNLCNIHIIPMNDNSIGENRIIGFNSGKEEFVSFIDDDDYILPGVIEKCLDLLKANPHFTAVGTLEGRLVNDTIIYPKNEQIIWWKENYTNLVYWAMLHHIVIFRRKNILPYLKYLNVSNIPERHFYKAMDENGLQAGILLEPGYIRRHHENNTHKKYNFN